MRSRYWVGIFLLALSSRVLLATDTPKDLKDKLEARYKQQKLKVVPSKITVGTYEQGGFTLDDLDFRVHYDHFSPGVEMPARYQKRDLFDEHTTQLTVGNLTGPAPVFDSTEPGEILECKRLAVRKMGKVVAVDLMLSSISAQRLAAKSQTAPVRRGSAFGVHFRFLFPSEVFESGDYEKVVREINPYFLPVAEYDASIAAASKTAEDAKNVNIQPGTSREQVVKSLGNPLKTITFGKKTILKYKDITVELEEDKVTDVKAN
jgi:hypothetical protein